MLAIQGKEKVKEISMKASRPIYPDLDCRCGAESTSFRVVEP